MMAVLLLLLLFGALQVAVYSYVCNVVQASAADGARLAASAGADPAAGVVRASHLIAAGVGRASARRFTCRASRSRDEVSALPTVTVQCRGPSPALFLPVGIGVTIDVSGSSLQEERP